MLVFPCTHDILSTRADQQRVFPPQIFQRTQTMAISLVSFSLGPVQSFIESARSVRDLWTGSYLLSWLTYHAIQPVLSRNGKQPDWLIFPAINLHPLWMSDPGSCANSQPVPSEDLGKLLSPCLPNRFLAIVPLAEAEARLLAKKCEQNCRDEWQSICDDSYEKIAEQIRLRLPPPWHDQFDRELWDAQTQSFFEMQSCVVPMDNCIDEVTQCWLGDVPGLKDSKTPEWSRSWTLLQSIFAASRAVRHVPQYGPINGIQVAPKCSILGSYEQMGPAELDLSKEFWKAFARGEDGLGVIIDGIGTRQAERFCAVSLVKRFAFATGLKHRIQQRTEARPYQINDAVRYPDTHTVAAAKWLEKSDKINGDFLLDSGEVSNWNGHWLHWEQRKQADGEESPSEGLWQRIQDKKRLIGKGKGPVPHYYAVLMLDGDKMGDRLRTASREDQTRMSRLMSNFALEVARTHIVNASGILIYSGGDDVLALLPVETALGCADSLQTAFGDLWTSGGFGHASASAGIALVHAKEDLRLALGYARKAERIAKNAGRNCLTLTTCRGSGEHSTAVLSWEFVSTMNRWVAAFMNHASDRWAYRLAAEMQTWSKFTDSAILEAELRRQVNRSDDETRIAFAKQDGTDGGIADDFQNYCSLVRKLGLNKPQHQSPPVGELFCRFITLVQSAAFIARGRDR